MAGGEHELVAVGMLRAPVIVAKAAERRPGQMHRDVVRRIGKRPAEVARLRVIPEQGQGHARHEPDVLEPLFVFGIQQGCARRCRLYAHLYSPLTGGGLEEVILVKKVKSKKWKVKSGVPEGIIRQRLTAQRCHQEEK